MTRQASVLVLNPRNQNRHSTVTLRIADPLAPKITLRDLWRQFKRDVYGKEVQTTSTYSYTWMADQIGHICLGIAIGFLLTAIASLIGSKAPHWALFLIGSILVLLYELRTYLSSVRDATGRFRLDDKCLRDNALIAAVYMILGVGASFGFQRSGWWILISVLALIVLAIVLAPPWLRQKIIWQKAGLPYLFRLADAKPTISDEAAKWLQDLIDGGPPARGTSPRQVVVGGPIGSGRTPLAAGIGTEFAFKKAKVRYLSLNTLLECAARSSDSKFYDDTGPANIVYWRWCEAQVIIIDDVGPVIGAAPEAEQRADLNKFRMLLQHDLAKVKAVFSRCHTVWVMGDLLPDGAAGVGQMIKEFADVIADFCDAKEPPLPVELSEIQRQLTGLGPLRSFVRWFRRGRN
jgi:hypothetical protein